MNDPHPALRDDAPLEVFASSTLFATGKAERRHFAGLQTLPTGRIVLSFMYGSMPRRNDGATMVAVSDDHGATWSEPRPLFAIPGWDCFPNGGPCRINDDHLRLFIGQYQFAPGLGGKQPFGAEWITLSTDSFDGGGTWSPPAPDPRIFPAWTEFYGASNPIPLADGRLMWGVSGTQARDKGWQVGVTFSDAEGSTYSAPVIIAANDDCAYSDGDNVRLSDGRILAVLREHLNGGTLISYSADDGQTWSGLQPAPFAGANFKLTRLASGAVVCLYRDEDPAHLGVSMVVSEDGGDSWSWVGQLYAAPENARHNPGYFCGAPDLESLGHGEYAAVLHTYEDDDGEMCIHFFNVRER